MDYQKEQRELLEKVYSQWISELQTGEKTMDQLKPEIEDLSKVLADNLIAQISDMYHIPRERITELLENLESRSMQQLLAPPVDKI